MCVRIANGLYLLSHAMSRPVGLGGEESKWDASRGLALLQTLGWEQLCIQGLPTTGWPAQTEWLPHPSIQ